MSISSVKERREKIYQMSKTRITCTNLLERSLGRYVLEFVMFISERVYGSTLCLVMNTKWACTFFWLENFLFCEVDLVCFVLVSRSHHWWEQSASDVDFMRKTHGSQMIYLMIGSFALWISAEILMSTIFTLRTRSSTWHYHAHSAVRFASLPCDPQTIFSPLQCLCNNIQKASMWDLWAQILCDKFLIDEPLEIRSWVPLTNSSWSTPLCPIFVGV